jgi:hypothetical protein
LRCCNICLERQYLYSNLRQAGVPTKFQNENLPDSDFRTLQLNNSSKTTHVCEELNPNARSSQWVQWSHLPFLCTCWRWRAHLNLTASLQGKDDLIKHAWVVNNPAFYSEYTRFESLDRRLLLFAEFLIISNNPLYTTLGYCLLHGNGWVFPYSVPVHYFSYILPFEAVIICVVEKVSLNCLVAVVRFVQIP